MKLNKKALVLIAVLATAILLTMSLNVRKAHADILSLSLTSPANNTHVMDTTPDFIFLPLSNVTLTKINCTLYVEDIASGDVEATNNTETTITCNHTLTVSEDPLEWYINATDADETAKSEVRNIYMVPSTGLIDIPDVHDYEEDEEVQSRPRITSREILGVIALCAFITVFAVVFGGKKTFQRVSTRTRR